MSAGWFGLLAVETGRKKTGVAMERTFSADINIFGNMVHSSLFFVKP